MRSPAFAVLLLIAATVGCQRQGARGIADRRSDFGSFLPMAADPARDGLKEIRPYFRRANRPEILRAIEQACVGGRSGESHYDRERGTGYYVNCNPRNRQLLNGYAPLNPSEQPHSR